MDDIDARIQALAGDHAPIVIEAAVDDALTGIDAVDTAANDLSSIAPSVLVDADTAGAEDGIAAVDDAVQQLADENPIIHIEADTSAAQSGVDQFSGSLGKLGAVAGGVVLGKGLLEAGGQLLGMAKAAAEDEASVARLKTAVDNGEGGWAKYGVAIDAAIKKGQALAFTDDQTRDALSTLTAITGSAGTAMDRLGTAQDLARGTGMDLSTAARLVGKVTDENVNVFKRYGISVEAGATAQDLLNKVDEKFHGQAGTFADSDAGKFAKMSDKVDELKEALGAALLPAISLVVGAIGTLVGAITEVMTSFEPAKAVVEALGVGLGVGMVVALGAMGVAAVSAAVAFTGLTVAALPWIALAAAIGIAVYELVKHWDDLTARFPILQTALDELKAEWTPFVALLESGAKSLIQIIMNLADVWRAEFDAIVTIVMAFGQVFDDVIHGRFSAAKDDAVQGAKDIADAFVNMGQQVIGVFDGVSVSLDKSSSSYEQYKEPLEMFAASFDAAAVAAGMMGKEAVTVGDSISGMVQWIDNAAHSMDGYRTGAESAWSAQSALNDMLSDASGKVSFWEGNLKTAEGALKILNDQVESGTPLTAKQSAEQDILTTAVGRYQGGVEDAQGAVVDAAAAQAEFILIQDDLNGKLAAGTITQGEYNAQMADATSKIDPATSAAYGLATAQDTVAVAIDGVVNKLGNMLIDLGLLPESKRTEFQTPGLDEAISGTQLLGEGIGALPTEFTIYASLDYTAFDAGIQHIAGYTPQSPAKEGPLSKVPDWSFMTWTLKPTMDAAVQTISDSGTSVMGVVTSVSDTVAANVPDWAIMFSELPGVTANAEHIFELYMQGVMEDGDYLNDWLTHLPEQLRGPAEEIGRKVAAGVAVSTTVLPPLMYDTGVQMMSSFYDGASSELDNMLGPSGGLVNKFEEVLGPNSPLYTMAGDAGYGAGVSFVYGFATGVGGLSDDVLKNLKAMIPKLGDGATQLVQTIVDTVGRGAISMEDAAALFTLPMVEQLKTLEDNLKVQLAQAWLDGTDPGPIQAQLDIIHELYGQATLDLLTTADAAHLLGNAYMDTGTVTADIIDPTTAASGAIGLVGEAAATTTGYLIDMGGYLNETALLMGNVAAGATSMYDALNSGLVGGDYTGGGPGGPGSGTSGSFLTNGQYNPFPAGGKGGVDAVASAVGDAVGDAVADAVAPLTQATIAAASGTAAVPAAVAVVDPIKELIATMGGAAYMTALRNGTLPGISGPTITPTPGNGDCPPAVNLYLSAEDQTTLARWQADKQAALAGMHSGLRAS